MPKARYYTIPKAAKELLGWDDKGAGQRLRRLLRSKERILGKKILLGERFKITEAQLRRYCSELFLHTPDDLANEVKAYVDRIDSRVRELVDARVAELVADLRAEIATLKQKTSANTASVRAASFRHQKF